APADAASRPGDDPDLSLQIRHAPFLDEGALARELSSDDQLLDLARPFVQRRDAGVAQVLADGILVDVAVTPVHLHRGVRGAHRRLAGVVLRDRRLERVPYAVVRERRGAPAEHAGPLP